MLALIFPSYSGYVPNPDEYSVGKATRILANITMSSPVDVFDASFELDGFLKKVVPPSPYPSNFNFVASFVFTSAQNMADFLVCTHTPEPKLELLPAPVAYSFQPGLLPAASSLGMFNSQPLKLEMDDEISGIMQLQYPYTGA
eukprot:gene32206-16757_t